MPHAIIKIILQQILREFPMLKVKVGGFMSSSTAKVILGQVLRIVTCGSLNLWESTNSPVI